MNRGAASTSRSSPRLVARRAAAAEMRRRAGESRGVAVRCGRLPRYRSRKPGSAFPGIPAGAAALDRPVVGNRGACGVRASRWCRGRPEDRRGHADAAMTAVPTSAFGIVGPLLSGHAVRRERTGHTLTPTAFDKACRQTSMRRRWPCSLAPGAMPSSPVSERSPVPSGSPRPFPDQPRWPRSGHRIARWATGDASGRSTLGRGARRAVAEWQSPPGEPSSEHALGRRRGARPTADWRRRGRPQFP